MLLSGFDRYYKIVEVLWRIDSIKMTPENDVFKQTYNANFNDAKQLSPLALSWLCKPDTNVIFSRIK